MNSIGLEHLTLCSLTFPLSKRLFGLGFDRTQILNLNDAFWKIEGLN